MKAAVRTRYGPPEVVRIAEVDKPAPGDGELLVRVHATTVNRTDCGWLAVKPFVVRFFTGLTRPRLTVLGNEHAGRVEAVGAGVTSFEVGDRVFGFTGLRFGAHAEYLAVPQDDAPVGPDRRGVPVRRIGAEGRQRRDRRGAPRPSAGR
jgi:NADPH:quinone reductase-like Zn-dependent oxidoreductase